MKKCIILIVILFNIHFIGQTQINMEKRSYRTERITGKAPVIDGDMNDEAWLQVKWDSGFIQRQPYEDKAPSQQTSFKILYDDDNLYVLIRAFDNEASKIDKRLSRRDGMDGDLVAIQIDSYNDKLTAFDFVVSAAGVKSDVFFSNDRSNSDLNWDAIWYAKTSIDKEGWTAEYKIPLSQLRFDKSEEQIWGLQVVRLLYRKNETSCWQRIPVNASGWVSKYGELTGIKDVKPKRQIEVQPYIVGKYETQQKEDGNPFQNGKKFSYSAGVDGKIGITNNFILDFTANPDFGQVEADPSEVNLTGFETYYQEKRPFFIEGNNILSFPLTPGNSGASSDNIFYSRRIGRPPHYFPENTDYIDMPSKTNILGAFKVSGKTKQGLSIGIIESMTQREIASTQTDSINGKQEVEPLTNYFVSRIQKDINKGSTRIGGIFSAANRDLSDPALKYLHKAAYTGGIDFDHYWKDKTYYISIKTLFSNVQGDSIALIKTQRSPVRYFQRPDADYVKLDSNRTSLNGTGGILEFGKIANGHWNYDTWINWRSPGLELNDIGFIRRTDDIFQVFWAGYRYWEPFGIFRDISIDFNEWTGWDFGGNSLYKGGNAGFNGQLKNYWYFGIGLNYDGPGYANSLLRGGPSFKTNEESGGWFSVNSDYKKKLSFGLSYFSSWGYKKWSRTQDFSLSFTYHPMDAINVCLSPGYTKSNNQIQYISTLQYNNEKRYILGSINQTTLRASLRIDYSITPNLTIQYYGQPFIATGNYFDFKYVTNSKADQFEDRFHLLSESEIIVDNENVSYLIDENRDGITDYSFDQPDFKVLDFISNMVIRWEYTPGSTIYFVWSQNRGDNMPIGNFQLNKDANRLFDTYPNNVYLIKFSYRFRT